MGLSATFTIHAEGCAFLNITPPALIAPRFLSAYFPPSTHTCNSHVWLSGMGTDADTGDVAKDETLLAASDEFVVAWPPSGGGMKTL